VVYGITLIIACIFSSPCTVPFGNLLATNVTDALVCGITRENASTSGWIGLLGFMIDINIWFDDYITLF
jgi:hypothetical protein